MAIDILNASVNGYGNDTLISIFLFKNVRALKFRSLYLSYLVAMDIITIVYLTGTVPNATSGMFGTFEHKSSSASALVGTKIYCHDLVFTVHGAALEQTI